LHILKISSVKIVLTRSVMVFPPGALYFEDVWRKCPTKRQ